MLKAIATFSRRPLARRVASGVAANALGKFWVLITQLLSVPILAHSWGTDTYGLWLILTTIPTFLSLTDFGLGTAAVVELTKMNATHDENGTLAVFQSAWMFITGMSVLVALVSLTALALFRSSWDHNGAHVGDMTLNVAAIALYSLAAVQTQIVSIVYRSTHRYAKGTLLLDGMTFAEGLICIAVAAAGADLTATLLTMVIARLILLAIYRHEARRQEPSIVAGIRHANLATIRRLAHPSAAAMMLTLANALALQGVISTLGLTAGASAVAAFATARFIARTPLQFTALVSRATLPELTRAQFSRDRRLTKRLLTLNVASAMAVSIPATGLLLIFAPQLVLSLSHGTIHVPLSVTVPIVLASLFNSLWTNLATPLIAANRYSMVSVIYLCGSAVSVISPFFAPEAAAVCTGWVLAAAELVTLFPILLLIRRHALPPDEPTAG